MPDAEPAPPAAAVRVGVVLPVRDGLPYLGEAIESILGQTHRALTLVIVDDGSVDGSAEVAAHYAATDARVRVVRTDGVGPARARNAGIATLDLDHELVAAMDADDIALPHRIERQVQAAQLAPEVKAWGCRMELMAADGHHIGTRSVGPSNVEQWRERRARGELIMLVGATIMARRTDIDEVGGYQPGLLCDDFDLTDRLAATGPVVELSEILVRYRVHGGGVSHARFAEQSLHLRYVWHRAGQRARGEPLDDLEAFRLRMATEPRHRRLRWAVQDRSRLHMRRAAIARGEGHRARAAAEVVAAVALDPGYTAGRVWTRIIEPRVRGRSGR